MGSVAYILVDAASGLSTGSFSVPARLFDPTVPAGQRMVVPADGVLPTGDVKVDLRKVRREIVAVDSIASVEIRKPSEVEPFETKRLRAIFVLDRLFAARIDGLRGPLASLHAEKRRQAEAGGGALVADEADRLAILANAARQDEAIAAIDAERRTIKAALKAATTEDEIDAAIAAADELEGSFA